LHTLVEFVCSVWYLHPLSFQQNTKSFFLCMIFSIPEHLRSSLPVPRLQASVPVSGAFSLSCLDGRIDWSRSLQGWILHVRRFLLIIQSRLTG
jgi:hypothetical protein